MGVNILQGFLIILKEYSVTLEQYKCVSVLIMHLFLKQFTFIDQWEKEEENELLLCPCAVSGSQCRGGTAARSLISAMTYHNNQNRTVLFICIKSWADLKASTGASAFYSSTIIYSSIFTVTGVLETIPAVIVWKRGFTLTVVTSLSNANTERQTAFGAHIHT